VTGYDPYGNVASNYTGTVAFTSSDVTATLPPDYTFTTANGGMYTFTAILRGGGPQTVTVTDTTTASVTGSASVNVNQLAARDLVTQGNWIGPYGSQGYLVVSGPSSFPPYATETTTGASTWTWTAQTTDVRALQTGNGSGRVAASWQANNSFTIDVKLTDGLAHKLSLYALDWDARNRSEQIQITNPSTGSVLDTETISSFSGGVYLDWTVSGEVLIQVTRVGGPNAVISGLFLDPVPASATLVGRDTVTQGNWIGAYGSLGYNVIGDAAAYPRYATVTPTGVTTYTWAKHTTDVRALQYAGGRGRIAAAWSSSTTFSVDVNLTDGQAHNLSLYALDWGLKSARSEQIQLIAAATGAVLDTETVSAFRGGVYLDWTVRGNVFIQVTRLAGPNAVISGLFLDPGPATAKLVGQDNATQGNWIGVYGSQGYNVIGNAAVYPSYAIVTPLGARSHTWAAQTTDVRALQTADGSSRVAAQWWASPSFTVDVNLTDGQAHNLSLYLLDWDARSRIDQIQIINPSSGTVLDTETVSSFTGGVYLDWTVSGEVLIVVTKAGGGNASISGLFLDPAPAPAIPVGPDTVTQGNGIGAYTSPGYTGIGNAAVYAPYTSVTPVGALTGIWAEGTADVRALQNAGGSGPGQNTGTRSTPGNRTRSEAAALTGNRDTLSRLLYAPRRWPKYSPWRFRGSSPCSG
jgi:hypothetical protein